MLIRLLIFLCTLTTAFGQYQLLDNKYSAKKKTRIIVSTMSTQLPASGFATIQVTVRNDEKNAVTWNFDFTHTDYSSFPYYRRSSSGESELKSADSVTCEAGKEKTVNFLVPLLTHFSNPSASTYGGATNQLQININADGLGSNHCQIDGAFQENWPSILISKTLYLPSQLILDREVNTAGHHSGISFGSMFNPEKLSSDWQSYTGFDRIILSDKDWLDIDPGARSAILAAVRLGSDLSIYSPQGTNFKELQIKTNGPAASSIKHGSGNISLSPWQGEHGFNPERLVRKLESDYKNKTRSGLLTQTSTRGGNALKDLLGNKSFNVALVVLVLILFGILVGPVNLFVFAKGGKRHKLFITTPLISIAASLLLLLVILFQDGIGGKGHRAVIMQVYPGENENSAYLTQHQFSRTGVLFGTGFETEKNTWVSPVVIPETRWARVHDGNFGSGSRYEVQSGDDKIEHSGDWFQSRSEFAHHALGVVSTRGRIELKNSSGAPSVQSTFDFPITDFFYLSADGTPWKTDQIGKGQNVTLQPATDAEYNAWIMSTMKKLPRAMKPNLQEIVRQPGHYYAITSEGPAIETSDSIKWESTNTIVTGPIYQP